MTSLSMNALGRVAPLSGSFGSSRCRLRKRPTRLSSHAADELCQNDALPFARGKPNPNTGMFPKLLLL
jgi:hypothetical protein